MLNALNEEDRSRIWIPNIIFENACEKMFIKNDDLSSISIKREGNPLHKFSFEQNEYEEFKGKYNSLKYQNTSTLQLICEFNLHFYPFDTQGCLIMVSTLSPLHTCTKYAMVTKIMFLHASKISANGKACVGLERRMLSYCPKWAIKGRPL